MTLFCKDKEEVRKQIRLGRERGAQDTDKDKGLDTQALALAETTGVTKPMRHVLGNAFLAEKEASGWCIGVRVDTQRLNVQPWKEYTCREGWPGTGGVSEPVP